MRTQQWPVTTLEEAVCLEKRIVEERARRSDLKVTCEFLFEWVDLQLKTISGRELVFTGPKEVPKVVSDTVAFEIRKVVYLCKVVSV